ncbi:MAG: entericidin A/B family lipoprotein [Burkholderiaceae bacterium]|jgi:predicted small secreted protein|nr:entericidin A/B family lipoprotein [Burkholderiaceae bacterium]
MKAWTAVVAAALLMLAGCNTLEGIGKDVEKAGEALQGAAKKR